MQKRNCIKQNVLTERILGGRGREGGGGDVPIDRQLAWGQFGDDFPYSFIVL